MTEPLTFEDARQQAVTPQPQGGTPKPTTTPQTGGGPTSFEDALKERFVGKVESDKSESKPATFDSVQREAAIDRENHYLGGLQRTTPFFDKHGEPLGTAYWDELGKVSYKDKTGQWVDTDDNHIVLRDPSDAQYKVFGRKPETETGFWGGARGGAELLAQGLATNAPTKGLVGPVARLKAATGVDMAPNQLMDATAKGGIPIAAASDNPTVQGASHLLARLPIAGTPLRRSIGEMGGQLEEAAGVAEKLPAGERVLPEEAGATVAKTIDKYIDTKPQVGTLAAKSKQLYDKVDSLIDPTVTTATTPNLGAPANVGGGMNNTMNTVQRIGKMYDAADWDKYQSAISEVLGPLTKPGGINYDTMKFVIRNIGELLENPSRLPAGVKISEIKQIYGSLKDDMRTLIQAADKTGQGEAVKAWDQANKWHAAASARREKLANLIGVTGDKSDEAIFGRILTMAGSSKAADWKTLSVVRRSMPADAWNDVVGAVVQRLGWSERAKPGEVGGVFDPSKFLGDYNAIPAKSKDLLFGATTDSQLRNALDSIAQISSKWGQAKKIIGGGHPSHLGEIATTVGVWELAQHLMYSGEMKPFLAALTAALGGRGVSHILSMPASAEKVADWGRSIDTAMRGKTLQDFYNTTKVLALTIQNQYNVSAEEMEKKLRGAIPQKLQDAINGHD